ncbi:MAG: hypothetical protein AAGI25_18910, partial [Bacteroidota bacterium]
LTNIIPYGIPPAGGSPINVSKPYPPATGSGFYISSRIRVGIQLTIKCIGFAWLLEELAAICYFTKVLECGLKDIEYYSEISCMNKS